MDPQQAKRFEHLEDLAARLSFLIQMLNQDVTEDFKRARERVDSIAKLMDEIEELREEIGQYEMH